MSTNKLEKYLIFFIIIFLYLLIGATILIYRHNLSDDLDKLTQLLLFSSIIEIGIYYSTNEYKSKLNLNTIIFAFVKILISLLYANGIVSLYTFCIIWGAFEVARAMVNIPKNIYIVHRHREYLRFFEIVVSIVELAFGILLIIGTIEHLKGHLMVFALTLFANAIIFTLDTLLGVFKDKIRH